MRYRCYKVLWLLLFIAFPLQAAVYQWTDENGRVHFSDRPTHESATEKTIRTSPGGSSQSSSPVDWKQKRQRMLDVYEQERAEKREAKAKRKEERKERKRQCREARVRYENYRTAGAIYDLDDEGERTFLDKQQRKQYLAELKADVERYCD